MRDDYRFARSVVIAAFLLSAALIQKWKMLLEDLNNRDIKPNSIY